MRQTLLFTSAALVALALTACGGDRRPAGGDSGTGSTCSSDAECDDGFPCTVDTCGVGGVCTHAALNELCTAPQTCEVGRGCVDMPSCASNADCDDGASCTLDTCGVGGVCSHMAIDARCADAGPGSTCDPATGDATTGCTTATGCATDADCDDTFACTVDTCGVDNTCGHTAIDARCAAGERCTTTSGCFASSDCTTDPDCDDGNFCNGIETCSVEFGCEPAAAPRACDDSDACTLDSCDTTSDMCVFACDSSRAECMCPAPAPPCDGIFDITPAPSGSCALGMVNFNVSQVTFSCPGPILSVSAMTSSWAPMTQTPRPTGADFMVETVVAGGCEEHYTLTGTFSDPDHFTGMLTTTYIDTDGFSCSFGGCANHSFPVTGTRRP